MQNFVISNRSELDRITPSQEGELVYDKDTNKIYAWDGENWVEVGIENSGLQLNLYELNKNIIGQLEPLTANEVGLKQDLIDSFVQKYDDSHFMLLCKDYNYYTLFEEYPTATRQQSFFEAFSEIILGLGEIYSIDNLNNGSIEIWIKPTGENTPYVFYLFPYDAGVVYYE